MFKCAGWPVQKEKKRLVIKLTGVVLFEISSRDKKLENFEHETSECHVSCGYYCTHSVLGAYILVDNIWLLSNCQSSNICSSALWWFTSLSTWLATTFSYKLLRFPVTTDIGCNEHACWHLSRDGAAWGIHVAQSLQGSLGTGFVQMFATTVWVGVNWLVRTTSPQYTHTHTILFFTYIMVRSVLRALSYCAAEVANIRKNPVNRHQ